MMFRALLLTLLAMSAATVQAVGTAFTYQGYLTASGEPALGTIDARFTLQDALGAAVATPLVRDDVPLHGGVFTVELDFGAVFDGAVRQLVVEVRPGADTGAFTALSPAVTLLAAPYALHSEASNLALTVAPNGVGSAAIADGSVAAVDIDASGVQRRVSGACAPGSAMRSVGAAGDVVCENIDPTTGDITSITVTGGLAGGGTAGDVSVSIAANGVDSQKIADGSIVAADVDASQVQLRITPACAAGMMVQSVSATGVPTCAAPALDSYAITIPSAASTATAATNCQNNGGQQVVGGGTNVAIPAGTYLVTMPAVGTFDLIGGTVNAVAVRSVGSVELSLRDASTIHASSLVSFSSGNPTASTASESFGVDANATVLTFTDPVSLSVSTTLTLAYCGTVAVTPGKKVRLVRLR